MGENSANIRGIRIRTVNAIMLVLSMLLFLIVLYTTIQIAKEYSATIAAIEKYIKWERSTHDMHLGSDVLTEEARLYVETRNPTHVKNYFSELVSNQSRDRALREFAQNTADPKHRNILTNAFNISNELAHREIYAMRLVADGNGEHLSLFPDKFRHMPLKKNEGDLSPQQKQDNARNLLFDSEYIGTKNNIKAALSEALSQNLSITRAEQKNKARQLGEVLMEQRIVLIALCVLNIATFMMIIILIVKPLKIYLKCIKDDKMLELVGAYEFKHLALTYNDIFALKQHHDKMLKHKAEHDQLTGLLNRSAFETLLPLLENNGTPVGFAIIDVDKFKQVNDTWGHEVGDRILCRVARLLKRNFRADDFCIRLGGDEFAVILNGVTVFMESSVKEKVDAINEELGMPEEGLPAISISVGVAFSENGFAPELYRNADSALYEIKKAGRRACGFYRQ